MEDAIAAPPYVFRRGLRVIVAEMLFPKKVAYQPEMFKALREGLNGDRVKEYLLDHADDILHEMAEYPQLFDPLQYGRRHASKVLQPTPEEALERMKMYTHYFRGWSMYEVDGMFEREEYEERTQVLRIIFRLESTFASAAKEAKCYDVLEALMRWVMAEHMRLDHILPWSKKEKQRFVHLHGPLPKYKQQFLDTYYEAVTKVAKRWVDDTGLFVFGYLVRRFWVEVLKQKRTEEEIWTVSWFNANLNMVKKI